MSDTTPPGRARRPPPRATTQPAATGSPIRRRRRARLPADERGARPRDVAGHDVDDEPPDGAADDDRGGLRHRSRSPPGWEGRISKRGQPSVAAARVAGAPAAEGVGPEGTPAERPQPIAHLANFPLPEDRGDFGSGAVDVMGSGDVLVVLFEYGPESVGQPLFSREGMPARPDAQDVQPVGAAAHDAGPGRMPGLLHGERPGVLRLRRDRPPRRGDPPRPPGQHRPSSHEDPSPMTDATVDLSREGVHRDPTAHDPISSGSFTQRLAHTVSRRHQPPVEPPVVPDQDRDRRLGARRSHPSTSSSSPAPPTPTPAGPAATAGPRSAAP